jgi:hypothetical protein
LGRDFREARNGSLPTQRHIIRIEGGSALQGLIDLVALLFGKKQGFCLWL